MESPNSNVTIYADAWDINSASSVASGGVSVFEENIVAMLKNNLSGGDVIVGLRDSSLGLTSALNYDTPNDLTLLSVNDLDFGASVQNSNNTGGALNLIAGWDGTTVFEAVEFRTAVLSSTGIFGRNNGTSTLAMAAKPLESQSVAVAETTACMDTI